MMLPEDSMSAQNNFDTKGKKMQYIPDQIYSSTVLCSCVQLRLFLDWMDA